jgi:hypothetical protein
MHGGFPRLRECGNEKRCLVELYTRLIIAKEPRRINTNAFLYTRRIVGRV